MTASRECAWTASSEAAWIIIIDGQSGQGDGSLSFEVGANPSPVARTASIAVNDQRAALTQAAAECRFALDHATATFGSQGGSDSVVVTTVAACEWTARSLVPWISITAGASSAGSGTVAFTVASSSGGARRGEIVIAGHTFTVDQGTDSAPAPLDCTASINPTTLTASAAGGSMSANLSTPAGCRWTATSTTPWLTLRSGSGIGSSVVQIDVSANSTTTARTGSAMIAGRPLAVQQAAADPQSCTYSISPTRASAPVTGGPVTTTVDTTAGCAWTASTTTSWLVVRNASGTGAGSVQVDAAPNLLTAARTGSATVAGRTFTVEQAAADPQSCIYSISPTQASAPVTGGSVVTTVDTTAGCAWTVSTATSWLVVRTASGTGAGSVQVDAAPNLLTTARTGSVTVAGRTFTVEQAGVVTPPPPPPSCSYTVSPTRLSVPATGGSASTTVDTQATCAWTAVSNVSWLTVVPGGRTGDGTVQLVATANAGTSARTGTATVAGVTVSVEQAGSPPPCTYRISPTEVRIPRNDQSVAVSVDAPGGCAWHATSHNNWIDVIGVSSGTGPGTVRFRVDDNRSQNEREGSVTIAGETFSIIQAGRRSDLEDFIVPLAAPSRPR